MTIWQKCDGDRQLRPIQGRLYRLVESQEQIATMGFVDTLEEQALLEELLEASKPAYPQQSPYHYLLHTPFRYPPLPYGSRFGSRAEPSLFYGGLDVDTVLAESAYYRFVFWYSMAATPVKTAIQSKHSLFTVRYKTGLGMRLHHPPFDEFQEQLTDPLNYSACQALGAAMRKAGVHAFEYCSARTMPGGLCVALFTPEAFASKKPSSTSSWLCELQAVQVTFKKIGTATLRRFPLSNFLVGDTLPRPA